MSIKQNILSTIKVMKDRATKKDEVQEDEQERSWKSSARTYLLGDFQGEPVTGRGFETEKRAAREAEVARAGTIDNK